MKRLLWIFAALATMAFAGCNNKVEEVQWYDGFEDGGPFKAGNFLRFIYVDENGNDLIDPSDLSTLPVASDKLLDSEPEIPGDYDPESGWYCDELNQIAFNDYRQHYEYFTWVYGDSRRSDYTFYVYFKGQPDRMDVRHKYVDQRDEDGYYYSTVVQWQVNGVTVYPNRYSQWYTYVYICKSSDGSTSIEIR